MLHRGTSMLSNNYSLHDGQQCMNELTSA